MQFIPKNKISRDLTVRFALGLCVLSFMSCKNTTVTTLVEKNSTAPIAATRNIASQPDDYSLVYFTYDNQGSPTPQEMTPQLWAAISEGARYDFLTKLYYANTRVESLKGIRHDGCFQGHASGVQEYFFNSSNSALAIANVGAGGQGAGTPNVSVSEDGMMMGLSFDVTQPEQKHFYFRLHNCNAGKTPTAGGIGAKYGAAVSSFLKTPRKPASAPASVNAQGFLINDTAPKAPATLPKFALRADYDKAGSADLPWRTPATGNIQTPKAAFALAVLMQKYFYENMANQNASNPDQNFISLKNTKRYWCNMPWQNQGPAGREAIHGLTKERNLVKSTQMTEFANPPAGTDWGVGYYNSVACAGIENVFGTQSAPKDPDFSKANYADGSVAAKILFTTGDFPAIHNSYTWNANVSGTGSNTRSIQTVRHIQMDISIKDSKLAGANPNVNGWVMLTYYYDDKYDYAAEYQSIVGGTSPLAALKGLPASLLKMRPMGIQYGMDANESLIFAGSQTNGFQNRLNGPADNPVSSCLSCHSSAGTQTAMVPGFMSDKDFTANHAGSLDFSQQFALAKRNYETVDPAAASTDSK